uniref:5-methylcytosine-specific restriction enzyme A n=1 Tax=Candidatus Kentrum sp. LFY TaxID=2126342 RepID=A0A450UP27_9GAMM|nr:MAG: 5-methylcytosine-specific restriction enzyme A [Candidatus Kentron sp. LFY]
MSIVERELHQKDPSKKHVEKAFLDFDKGVRPDGYKPPRCWYVLSSNGKAYPAKAIWALVIGKQPASFNTIKARTGLANLGYSLINTEVLDQAFDFEKEVEKSIADTKNNRKKRLTSSSKKPSIIFTLTKIYRRNPDVVAEVLLRADGVCEKCKKPAPFNRSKDGTPYLEVHHIVQLSNDGDDTVDNSIALCPNCHREKHYG